MGRGFGIVDRDVMRNRNISLKAKGLYGYLCSMAGNSGACYPSRKTACYYMRITNNTLGSLLKELEEVGAITRTKTRNKNGTFQKNTYIINAVSAIHGNNVYGSSVDRVSDTDSDDTIKI